MKYLIPILLIIMTSSCAKINQDRLDGVWFDESRNTYFAFDENRFIKSSIEIDLSNTVGWTEYTLKNSHIFIGEFEYAEFNFSNNKLMIDKLNSTYVLDKIK